MLRQGRMVFSLLASAVAVGLSLWLTFRPESKSTEIAPYILGALLVAVLAGRRWLRVTPDWGWLALAVAVALLLPVTVIARAFGSIDMLALVFHIEFGTEGAGLGGLERDIAVGLFVAGTVFLGVLIFAGVAGLRRAVWVAALAILVANPVLRGVAAMALPGLGGAEESVMAHFVEPEILPVAGEQMPDVVIVYLEGTDRIFADTERFGDAMARLMELAGPGAVDLTGVGQLIGTGWSLSGMAASQCGVPVMPNGLRFGLNYEEQDRFMTEVTCLSDVLVGLGYRAEFMVGGDVAFAGINHFYDSHAMTEQLGFEAITAMMPPEDLAAANLGWIVDDQMLMDAALLRHAELTAGEAPVLLIVETSGPHGVDVWMSRRCTESGRAEVWHDNAAGVRCTGAIVADFVETLRSAPGARPTLFVLLSDHINHNPDLKSSVPIEGRRNLAILIPPGAGPEAGPLRVIDREATMIDIFPTVLDLLDLIPPGGGAGLGVSLLGETPTLVERFGRAEADRILSRDAALAERIWQ
jgi:phosphoglycerol transferase